MRLQQNCRGLGPPRLTKASQRKPLVSFAALPLAAPPERLTPSNSDAWVTSAYSGPHWYTSLVGGVTPHHTQEEMRPASADDGAPATTSRPSKKASASSRWRPAAHTHPPRPPTPLHAPHIACCPSLDAAAIFATPHFSDADWDRQRSWKRLLPHSTAVFVRVLAFYYPPLLVAGLVAVSVGIYESLGPPHHPGWPALSNSPQLKEPFALTSFILGLLLVFKTNAAYDRWAEGRAAWGGLLAEVRSIAREVCVWAGGRARGHGGGAHGSGKVGAEFDEAPGGGADADATAAATAAAVADALAWDAALLYILRRHLGRDDDAAGGLDAELARELAPLLPPEAVAWLLASARRPAAAALALSSALARLPISDLLLQSLEGRVHAYSAAVAACERLRRQPVPVAYTRHAGRFLLVWLFPLAAVFWGDWGWATPFLAVLITFLTCGVDNIGAQLEQPFDVLPLALLARTAHADVAETAAGWAGLLAGSGGWGGSNAGVPPWPVPAGPLPAGPESAGGESEEDEAGVGV